VARAVQASKEEHGQARAAVLTGSRLADEDAYAVGKYARTVLGTDDVDFRTRFAPETETAELAAVQGRDTATYAEVEAAPVIVVAGLDPAEEVPILFLRLRKAWRNHKARLVVVGPMLGSLAEYAWRRVASAPGHEAAALRELAEHLSAQGEPGEIAAALRDADAPVVLVGERAGPGTVTAAAALAEASGGKMAWVPRRAGARGALRAGLAPGLLPGGRRLDDDADRAEVEAEWGSLPETSGRDLHAVLTDAAAGKIDVLHLIGVDLLRDCDSPALAAKALKKVGTVVAQDLALNDTVAEHADVVLPATGTQERHGSYTNWEGRTQRFAKAVDGPQLVLDDWEILQQVAAMLGQDLGFSDLEGLRREMERVGSRSQPHEWPTVDAEADPDADGDAEGLQVIGVRLLIDEGTMLTDAVNLKATGREPWVELNAADAEQLGVADGDLVEVTGPKGSIRLPGRVGTDVVPGAVFVPANSTETPLAALGDESGLQRVTVSAVVDAEVGA
jgi:NADH-quinone oxidoreductase subunit G